MPASRFVRFTLAVMGFGFGAAAVASDDEEILRLKLKLIEQQRLVALQKQKAQPAQPAEPKAAPKPLVPLAVGAMPEGAISRLGDSRLRHAGVAMCVTFSPDGRRLVTGGQDGTLRVWDVATGEAIDALHQPSGNVAVARFTHGGTRLAATFTNSRLQFLNPDTLKEESTFSLGYGNEFAVSDDGKMIAGIGPNATLVVSELGPNLEKLEVPVQTPKGTLFAFHPGGKMIAVGEQSGKVTLYQLAGGKPVLSFEHGGPLNGLVFRADGKQIATGGSSGGDLLKVWDISDPKNVEAIAEVKGTSQPRAWIGADRIAAGGNAGVGVYDLEDKKWVGRVKAATGEWAISPDGTKLATTGTGALRVRLWDVATGKQLLADNDTFPDAALLAPTPDGKALFVLAGDGAYHWKLGTREATPIGTLPGRALAAAASGSRLAVATPGAVQIYDKFDPAEPLPVKPAHTLREFAATAYSVAISPDGKIVAYSGEAAGDDKPRIVLADIAAKSIRILPTQTVGLAMAFSPDGTKLAVVGRDGFLRLWPAGPLGEKDDDNDLWRVRMARGPRAGVAFSPDGKYVAATAAGLVSVIRAGSGEVAFTLERREFDDGIFQQLAFSPDSRLLITGSAGITGAVHVWEIATRSLVRRYTTGLGAINRLHIFPDGSRAASAGAEEVITVWDLTFRHAKAAPKLDELTAAWADLGDEDAAKGYPALQTLAAGGIDGLRTIRTKLEPSLKKQEQIARAVKQLGVQESANRAAEALVDYGYQALPALMAAANSESSEIRTRAAELFQKMTVQPAFSVNVPQHGLFGDALRLSRMVPVLEEIGGPEAEAMLVRIAALDGRPGDEAKAALLRMWFW